jgi:membrane protease YdiL (CAAX protease family)
MKGAPEVIFVCIFGLFIITDLAYGIAELTSRHMALLGYSSKRLFASEWSLMHVWIGVQMVLLGMLAISLLAGFALNGSFGFGVQIYLAKRFSLLSLLSLLPQNIFLVAVTVFFIVSVYKRKLSDIGFTRIPSLRNIQTGVTYGIGMLMAAFIMENLVQVFLQRILGMHIYHLLYRLNNELGNQKLVEQSLHSPVNSVILLIGGGLLAPIGEEFFFRGFFYNAAKHRFGVRYAMWITATVFALAHGGPLLILAILPVGLMLASAYEKSGSLWVPIMMHATVNSVQLIFAFVMKMK